MSPSDDAMQLLRALVPVAVVGLMVAKLALDWAGGKRPFGGAADAYGASGDDPFAGHDDGTCGDHGDSDDCGH